MSAREQLLISAAVIVGAVAVGYAARRLRWLGERSAKAIMTVAVVSGYATVQFLAIWQMSLKATDAWLPALGLINMTACTLVGLAVAAMWMRDRIHRGLLAIHGGAANTGVTMGGLVLLALYGERGLGLMSIYCLMWMPFVVLVLYPIARHYSPTHAGGSLGGLILRSVFDWRSIGLPAAIAAVVLSVRGVPRPEMIGRWHVPAIVAYATTIAAYFSIGLRLHFSHVRRLLPLIGGVAGLRFVVSGGVALALVAVTRLTPWPLADLADSALVIQAVMPTAVVCVAIANMFDLRPHESSTLFVINTAMFLVLVLPVILLLADRMPGR